MEYFRCDSPDCGYVTEDANLEKCPHCGGEVPQNAVFCGSCGRKVTEEELKEETGVRFCTVCGAKVEPDFAFCVNCGQKLG